MHHKSLKLFAVLAAAGVLVSASSACSSLPSIPGLDSLTGGRSATPPTTAGTISAGGLLLGPDGKALPGYLPRENYPDGVSILGAPPAEDSPQGRADRAIYEATRSMAGTPRWAQAVRDNDLSGPTAFKSLACTAGLTVTPGLMPRTTILLLRAGTDGALVADVPKRKFFRTRPLIGNDAKVCIAREDWLKTNGSYPSGHALLGWSWALILAELVPDRASAILTRGREFGDSRVICGVHFESDVTAGRTLGSAMISKEHADKGFLADLAAARREVAKFRASGAAPDCAGVTGL